MIPNPPTMTIPLRTDEHGAIRVGNTRVLLELVIHAYYMGETPEGIVESYSSLTTADVYAVIGYYLANPEEIDAYVHQRDAQADKILHDMEANLTPESRALRTRLLAYQEHQKDLK
ncbi:MAG: DUF433 domain-containing protein [Anaerolineae bacterium]|nr:DUF433 domain-containing protein [Anaerolineae bacterium]